ncbi:MAG TPA: PHB depolymerase family esterase, partial [Ohtaekwangia sp.]|nr:PHB depolymerase family esterase [Ohtaekwangia sp.]
MLFTRKPLGWLVLAGLLSTLSSCGEGDDPGIAESDTDLNALPDDTGGKHIAHVLGSTDADFGYYVYLPSGYDGKPHAYPLLIFLHGKDERGDGTNTPSVLNKVLNNGVPKLIKNKQWDPAYPMIVVSPQFHGTEGSPNNWGGGDAAHLKRFIKYMIDHYRVNTSRIYLTGMSHGGNGVYDYISQESDASSYIAAAVPVAAYGANKGFDKSKHTPIWAFVGAKDVTNCNTTKTFVAKFNQQVPSPVFT